MTMHATRQREAILRVMRETHRPMGAEEIRRAARLHAPSLALATVYRCLRQMAVQKQVVTVEYPGQSPLYELATGEEHAHFLCSGCGKVFDLPGPTELPAPPKLPGGFKVDGYEVTYYGRCRDCQSSDPGANPKSEASPASANGESHSR